MADSALVARRRPSRAETAMSAGPAGRWRVLFLGQGPLAEACYARLASAPEGAGLRVAVACSNLAGEDTWWRSARIQELASANGACFVSNAQRHDSLLARRAADLAINCLISVGHPWVIPEGLLHATGGVAFNLHSAPLPRFGGFNAASHAILEGAAHFGATLHWMDPRPDAGPIAFQARFEIPREATAKALHRLTVEAGRRLFGQLVDCLIGDRLPPRIPMGRPPTIYGRQSLSAHREIQDPADELEVDQKSRAFWFPPFEPAFYRRGGRKYYVAPASALSDMAGIR